MPKTPMKDVMTPGPHTIGHDQPLRVAWTTLEHHHIRHLPVPRAGQLVGLLSERDLRMLESIPGVDRDRVTVEEAMAQDVFVVSPDTPLGNACEVMAERKLGCIVVADHGTVVGIFSAVDAVRLLAHELNKRA